MSRKSQGSVKSALDAIKAKLESIDKKLDSILNSITSILTTNAYDDLPWKNFENGEGAWILADYKRAGKLVRRLKNAKGNVVFSGGYRFSLSKDGRFVRRHPLKAQRGR